MKVGVRCNDTATIDAGRLKFMPLFYGFNHPIYQEIEYRDLQNRVCYPEEVRKLLDRNMAFSDSALDLNHQGGDFCLEGKIKRHKMVAPKGDVTEDTWCKISRGIDGIEAICDGVSAKLKADQKESYRLHKNYQEIVHWRAVLRSSGIVCNFQEMGVVKNIYGETLSENM